MKTSFVPLKVTNLKKSYGKLTALDNLNFTLKKGCCVGLLGPNGAGKTTTCHLVSGLISPDFGEIEVQGLNFNSSRTKILEKIGVQLQESRFYEKYTIKETFELFASFYKESLDVEETIKNLGLYEKKDKRLSDLSGGQKQRVYLGCALVHDPQLLILDEPMTSLDPSSQKQTREFIKKLKEQGKTILLCTHNMSEAKRLCDHILILDRGHLICQGSSEELIEKYTGKEILSFELEKESDYTIIKEQLSWLPKDSAQNFEVGVNDGFSKAEELSEVIRKSKLKLKKMSLRPSNLEDVFFKVTGRNFNDQ